MDMGRKKRVHDGTCPCNGGDVSCRAMLIGGSETSTPLLHWQEGLLLPGVIEWMSDDERQGLFLKVVKILVASYCVLWITGAEAISEFREGVTVTKETKFDLSVVD